MGASNSSSSPVYFDQYVKSQKPHENKRILSITRYKDGEALDINKYLKKIFNNKSKKYWFHGTKYCSVLKIIASHFAVRPDSVEYPGEMLGPGIYLANNIYKTMKYGNICFVCAINVRNVLSITYESVDSLTNSPLFEKYDSVILQGKIDRYGEPYFNEAENKYVYDEICVKDPKNIVIKYIIEWTRPIVRTDGIPIKSCIYDYKNHTILDDLEDYEELAPSSEYHFVNVSLNEICTLMNLGTTDYVDLNLQNHTIYHTFEDRSIKVYKKIDNIKHGYVCAIKLFNKIETNTPNESSDFYDCLKIDFVLFYIIYFREEYLD